MTATTTRQHIPSDVTFLDGPYRDRAEAWRVCQDYAARLVRRGLAPDWGVEIRPITPGSDLFGLYLRSHPPGREPVPAHLDDDDPAPF